MVQELSKLGQHVGDSAVLSVDVRMNRNADQPGIGKSWRMCGWALIVEKGPAPSPEGSETSLGHPSVVLKRESMQNIGHDICEHLKPAR